MVIYLTIFLHFVADFVFQTDDMAKNKSSSNVWLAKHVAVYSSIMFLGFSFVASSLNALLLFTLVNYIAHFATDYVSSRITKKLWEQKRVHEFFEIIGLDQAIHMATLVYTFRLINGNL